MKPFLKPGQRVFIQVDPTGKPLSNLHFGRIAPRGGKGKWVDITDAVNLCCTTSTTTTTTTTS